MGSVTSYLYGTKLEEVKETALKVVELCEELKTQKKKLIQDSDLIRELKQNKMFLKRKQIPEHN